MFKKDRIDEASKNEVNLRVASPESASLHFSRLVLTIWRCLNPSQLLLDLL